MLHSAWLHTQVTHSSCKEDLDVVRCACVLVVAVYTFDGMFVVFIKIAGEPVSLDFCFELFSHVTKFFGYKVNTTIRYDTRESVLFSFSLAACLDF